MERVSGEPITDYARSHALALEPRLELVIAAADANALIVVPDGPQRLAVGDAVDVLVIA